MTDKTYQFLTAPRRTRLRILQLESKRRALEDSLLPEGIRYDGDKVQTSASDRMAAVCSEIEDLDREIMELRLSSVKQANAIEIACRNLTDEEERTVLMMYYVGHNPIQIIADQMGYSVQAVYKFRRLGQQHLENFL